MKIKKLRSPEEVLLRDGRTLKQALELHNKWILGEDGERLILKGEDLSYTNLSNTDLINSDLSYTNLKYSDLKYTNLRYANLRHADLMYADLRHAKFYLTNLSKN